MKIEIGPYKNWFGPHHLAEKICFWAKKDVADEYGYKDYPEYVFKLGELLAYGKWRGIDDLPSGKKNLFENDDKPTRLYNFFQWIESKRTRVQKVRIDRYDTWSMDTTLAKIVYPMLLQLKATKHGYPMDVDLEDVPENLQFTDWTEEHSWYGGQLPLFEMEVCNPEHISISEARWDWVLDEMIYAFSKLADDDFWASNLEESSRVDNGFRLFGKYYQSLWD